MNQLPYYFLPLSQGKSAIVDADTFRALGKYKWHYLGNGRSNYAVRNTWVDGKRVIVSLHRTIMGLGRDSDLEVDHIDGNGLNNRKENLRVCSAAENGRNKKIPKTNTTGYKGVVYMKRLNKFQAGIKVNQKVLYLGIYSSAEDASAAYQTAARKHFGEFARTT